MSSKNSSANGRAFDQISATVSFASEYIVLIQKSTFSENASYICVVSFLNPSYENGNIQEKNQSRQKKLKKYTFFYFLL